MQGQLRIYLRESSDPKSAAEIVLHDGPTQLQVFRIGHTRALDWQCTLAEGIKRAWLVRRE